MLQEIATWLWYGLHALVVIGVLVHIGVFIAGAVMAARGEKQ